MQQLRSLDNAQLEAAWVTIGSFDGVHRGHQALIREMVAGAHAVKSPAVVITFYPHPLVVLRKIQQAYYLTRPDERARLMFELGADFVFTLPFTTEFANLTADEFMQRLVSQLGLRSLWVGPGFALGRDRSGTTEKLQEIGNTLGYRVHLVTPQVDAGETISSSLIRQAIGSGDVARAAEYLGRFYSIEGEIVHGDGRGQGLGFPTANLGVWPEQLLPSPGIYVTWSWIDGQRYPSVTNVGMRPTFEPLPPQPRVEAYLLDFNRDVYGKQTKLEFVERIRAEERFTSAADLIEKIQGDVRYAREVFSHGT